MMLTTLLTDLNEMAIAGSTAARKLSRLDVLLKTDSFMVVALSRLPVSEWGRWLPLGRWLARRTLTAVYGTEIGKDVKLGAGVFFVHTVGVVIGGDSKVGARVKFFGNNTVGTAKDNGYPVIEDDVQLGCGCRILGPVRVGARSVIGANAVVLEDVPPDSVVVGVPGHLAHRRPNVATASVSA